MPSRKKAAPKKKAGKPGVKKPAKKASAKAAAVPAASPVRKPAPAPGAAALGSSAAPMSSTAQARPAGAAPSNGGSAPRPAVRPVSPGQAATAQQAEERRKAATRKLFARIRSLEAIVGADLRKRGSLLLSQAVDQWYAEATSATASDISITNAARAVISQL